MEYKDGEIRFNERERWIGGLAQSYSLENDEAETAFSKVLRARSHCYNQFVHLLRCDMDEYVSKVGPSDLMPYADRLRQLDGLSANLARFVGPELLTDFEDQQQSAR